MKYKVKYSPAAVRDLDHVWFEVYEASVNISTATCYINELMEKAEQKADFPMSGAPLYYEDHFTGYYYVVFKAYLAFYRIDGDSILIDRVLQSKSDYMKKILNAPVSEKL